MLVVINVPRIYDTSQNLLLILSRPCRSEGMVVAPVSRKHQLSVARNPAHKYVFTGYPVLPAEYGSIGNKPGENLVEEIVVLSTVRSSVFFVQVEAEKSVLDGEFPEFSGLDRHDNESLVAAFVPEFPPGIFSGLRARVIFHHVAGLLENRLVTYIDNDAVIHVSGHGCHLVALRIVHNIGEHVSVNEITHIALRIGLGTELDCSLASQFGSEILLAGRISFSVYLKPDADIGPAFVHSPVDKACKRLGEKMVLQSILMFALAQLIPVPAGLHIDAGPMFRRNAGCLRHIILSRIRNPVIHIHIGTGIGIRGNVDFGLVLIIAIFAGHDIVRTGAGEKDAERSQRGRDQF